jgi:hypothetical protein
MSLNERMAYAAALQDNINNPPTHTATRVKHYNVPSGTTPEAITFTGTTSRLVVKYDTARVGLGSGPLRITLNYRMLGRPTGVLSIGIRKASDDSFIPLAGGPIDTPGIPMHLEGNTNANAIQSTVQRAIIEVLQIIKWLLTINSL